jgi:hypothetical protein
MYDVKRGYNSRCRCKILSTRARKDTISHRGKIVILRGGPGVWFSDKYIDL